MMVQRLKLAGIAIAGFAFLACAHGAAFAQSKCTGKELGAAGKKAGGKAKCWSKATKKALAVDSACLSGAESKFSASYMKAQTKGDCVNSTDEGTIETKVDNFITDLVNEINGNTGTPTASKCSTKEFAAASKKAGGVLKCYAKAAGKGSAVDSACLSGASSKFGTSWGKATSITDCNTAVNQTDIETKVDNFAADVNSELTFTIPTCTGGPCACGTPDPTTLGFATAVGTGTSGSVTPAACVGGTMAGMACTMPIDCPMGSCIGDLGRGKLYIGGGASSQLPSTVPDYGMSKFSVHQCCNKTMILTATTAAQTLSNRDCTAKDCLYGPPLPIPNLATVALSTCVINSVAQDALGQGMCDAGSADINIPLSSAVFLTGDLLPNRCAGTTNPDNVGRKCTSAGDCPGGTCDPDTGIQPCPICNASTNKCNGGLNDVAGQPAVACMPGTLLSVGAEFPTSHDCPPSGSPFGTLPIPYQLTTGVASKTAVNQPSQNLVFCGFCATPLGSTLKNPPVPCTSDADCTGFTCGPPGFAACTACKQRNGGAFGNGMASTVTENGTAAGPIATGGSGPSTLVSVFCIPPTFNGAIDAAADLPGPGGAALQGTMSLQ